MQIGKAKNVRTFELVLGKRALIIFLLGICCVLFVVFLFGIKVGQIMDANPEKVAQGIPHVIMESFGWSPKKAETEVAVSETPKEPAGEVENKTDLTFYDTLAKKGKDTKTAEKENSGNSPVVVKERSSQQANTAATGQIPAKPSEKSSVPAVRGKYHVQVVSLKEKEKAERLCEKLVSLGYSPRIKTAELQNRGVWFRVFLEGFDSQEQAQRAVNNVSKKISGVSCVIKKND
jgi:cell division septation protein DedD